MEHPKSFKKAFSIQNEISEVREKTFSKLTWGPMTSGIANLMSAFGAPLLGAGLLGAIGVGGVPIVLALTIAAVGAALTVCSVVVNYIGSRTQNDGWLDQTELGAMSNAQHLIKELKANNLCLIEEHGQNCRADGKAWAQVVDAEPTGEAHIQQVA